MRFVWLFLICQWYLCLFVVFLVLTEVNNV